jgi:hypothetical protein
VVYYILIKYLNHEPIREQRADAGDYRKKNKHHFNTAILPVVYTKLIGLKSIQNLPVVAPKFVRGFWNMCLPFRDNTEEY